MTKKILFFIILFNIIGFNNIALSELIPLKKPLQTKEETNKKLLTDTLKPLPKPIEISKKKVLEKKVEVKKERKYGHILPKKNH